MSVVDDDAAAPPRPPGRTGARTDAATRFTEIFRFAHADLVRFVRARSAPARVDDVVAETFLVAWRRFDAVPSDPGMARAWLFTTARYLMLNEARHEGRRDHLPLRIDLSGGDEAAGVGEDRVAPTDLGDRIGDDVAARIDLAAAFRTLTAADQEVIGLSSVDGLSPAEGATVLGITANTYAARLSRARRRLREALGER